MLELSETFGALVLEGAALVQLLAKDGIGQVRGDQMITRAGLCPKRVVVRCLVLVEGETTEVIRGYLDDYAFGHELVVSHPHNCVEPADERNRVLAGERLKAKTVVNCVAP